jgi:hypothetical protein
LLFAFFLFLNSTIPGMKKQNSSFVLQAFF